MIKETYFFRDLQNLEILEVKTKDKINNNKIKSKYKIIETVKLDDKEFESFCNNFKHNYKFLYKYIEQMKVEEDGSWMCVEVKGSKKSVLVQSNGYSYPRFTGIVM